MKSSVSVVVLLSCSTLALAQGTSAPKTPPSSTPSTSTAPGSSSAGQLKLRGPEAVAQQDPNRIVATIDGKQITAQQAMAMLKELPEEQRRQASNLSALLQQLYVIDQFSGQAEKMKLDQESPWKEQLQLNHKEVLAQAYLNQIGKNGAGPSSADPQQYYNTHPEDFEQVKLSGILIAFNPPGTPTSGSTVTRTEADAQQKANDVEKKIKDGGDFSALARTDSDQQQSSVKGGDLGSFMLNDSRLPPEIKTAISKVQTGQVSEPIRVPGGYFILKVDNRTKTPFEQARGNIVQKLEVDKYKIQVQDPDFFASSAPRSNIPSLQRPATSQPAPTSTKPPGQ